MFLIPQSSYTISRIKGRGRGVFAARELEAGTVIGDYLGTLMRPEDGNEKKYGLYDMTGGDRYDILANPRGAPGVHLINHSCAYNCEVYPYKGHLLYFALRKIFVGEEIVVNYDLDASSESKGITAEMRVCVCDAAICRGTMHGNTRIIFDAWDKLKKQQFGRYYHKEVPGTYGKLLEPLPTYPASVADIPALWSLFGSEKKPPLRCSEKTLPKRSVLRERIRTTGRQLLFPQLGLQLYGMERNGFLLTQQPSRG